ncbi:MAG: YtxH domain-containing protein [Flavobacteriaceae bacterium]|nr:YtxH domain-containing protein [Flavobacteriaceae bacterium]
MSKERNSGIVLGLLAGAAIGSLLGILFAPDKGCETRKRVGRKAEDLRDDALDYYETLSEKARQGIDSMVSNVKHGYKKYKGKAEDFTEEVIDEVESEIKDLK